jgi:hypothetical protein
MKSDLIAFDSLWQTPAKTELHAFEQLKKIDDLDHSYAYLAFPWATYIDFLQTGKPMPEELVKGYHEIKKKAREVSKSKQIITVCQHIYASRYPSIFKACNISRIFWTHCTLQNSEIEGIEIKPFPLYSVQQPGNLDIQQQKFISERQYKLSFIGAYDPRYYPTKIREEIFKIKDFNRSDFLVIARENWHFQEEVYSKQISGQELEEKIKIRKEEQSVEYKKALLESIFSLCPSGSGPNSIRLWETLAFNSIPIIFSDTMALPGKIQDWIEAALFMPEKSTKKDIQTIVDSHCLKSKSEFLHKAEAIQKLYERYGNNCFVWDIINQEKSLKVFINNSNKVDDSTSVIPKLPAATSKAVQQSNEPYEYVIIDPGLKDVGSHHDKINRSVTQLLDRSIVFAHKKAHSCASNFQYSIKPIFPLSIYDEKVSHESAEYLDQVSQMSKALILQLKLCNQVKSLYVHTATASLVKATALAIQVSISSINKLKNVYLQLMFSPHSFIDDDTQKYKPKAEQRYATAIKLLMSVCANNNINLKIDTSNSIFKKQYNDYIGLHSIEIHPHVFSEPGTNKSVNWQPNGKILLHSGDSRPGKGLEWIGKSLEEIINNTREDSKFFIHAGHLRFPQAFPEIKEALEKISAISLKYPKRLEFKHGKLSNEEWTTMMNDSSRIYLLHNPQSYKNKTSGNFFDAIGESQGKIPLYLTSETLSSSIAVSDELSHGILSYGNTLDLIRSINEPPIRPPCTSSGFARFSSSYLDTDHSSHVIQRLSSENSMGLLS